jgi:rhodanese-related sulfurtransferase
MPLATLSSAAQRLARDAHYVVLCHHGMRSDMAATWLRGQGFANVRNLTGGIDAWSLTVDASIPRY